MILKILNYLESDDEEDLNEYGDEGLVGVEEDDNDEKYKEEEMEYNEE